MAKSVGSLVLLRDLLTEHTAAAVRLLILDHPWVDGWDYAPEALGAAAERLDRLYQAAGRTGPTSQAVTAELRRLLATDLNVPGARWTSPSRRMAPRHGCWWISSGWLDRIAGRPRPNVASAWSRTSEHHPVITRPPCGRYPPAGRCAGSSRAR